MVLIVQLHSQSDGLLEQLIGVSRPLRVLGRVLPKPFDNILCRHVFAPTG